MRKGLFAGLVICVELLFPGFKMYSQVTAVGARSISMAGVTVGLEDVWAIANNPAGLARSGHLSLATCLEQRYLLKETGYYGMAAAITAGKGGLGFFSMYSGYKAFINQEISLGYGRSFGDHVSGGVSLAYFYQKAGESARSVHQVGYQLGAIVDLSEKVYFAFAAFNPFQYYYKNKEYASLPTIFRIGISYHYSPNLLIHTECEKDLDYPPWVKLGMEYFYREVFMIRGGIRLYPVTCAFGAAFRHHEFLVEIASSYHQHLGFTPQISIQYDIQ
jgi:hypothetical protein